MEGEIEPVERCIKNAHDQTRARGLGLPAHEEAHKQSKAEQQPFVLFPRREAHAKGL